MEPDFGVIYEVRKVSCIRPSQECGTYHRLCDIASQIVRPDLPTIASNDSGDIVDPRPNGETIRRKSVSSKAKEVVTIGKSMSYPVLMIDSDVQLRFRSNPTGLGGQAERCQSRCCSTGIETDHYA